VECSFLSHNEEEQRLRDPAYRQQIADAIHIGIANYGSRRRMVTAAR
jgi:N-acetylmuramoyl-L-alanine amidase